MNDDPEIHAMALINEALKNLDDEQTKRVVAWAKAKFRLEIPQAAVAEPTSEVRPASRVPSGPVMVHQDTKEIPGIATLNSEGGLHLHVRDFKAKSANDAALRILHVAAWAWYTLTGERGVSSRLIIKPALEDHRVYNGNTRKAIKAHRGIRREGDLIFLDAHALREAEEFVAQILDDAVKGVWSPAQSTRRTRKNDRQSSPWPRPKEVGDENSELVE